uniref:Mobilization protein n=1 Tax=Meloidogyne hapla TaxID=6305 RepID=A0A1I8BGW3_MELHA
MRGQDIERALKTIGCHSEIYHQNANKVNEERTSIDKHEENDKIERQYSYND